MHSRPRRARGPRRGAARPWLGATLAALATAGCAGTAPSGDVDRSAAPPSADHGPAARTICAQLVAAPPHTWPERLPATLALGPDAVPLLCEALRADPDGAGAEAATAALGRLAGPAAHAFLLEQVERRSPLAPAASVALAECAEPAARDVLLAALNDRLADPALRAGCVGGLLRLRAFAEVAPVVQGLVLAGTPAGIQLQQQLGLPRKPRWAYERYLVIQALRRAAGTDFGLDTDLPWADLQAAAGRIDAWLQEQA